jgi:hypothetical protein
LKGKVKRLSMDRLHHITDTGLLAISGPNIEMISLSGNDNITDAVFSYFPEIEELYLPHCKKITGHGLPNLFKRPRRLYKLDLSFTNLADDALIGLGQCPNFQGIRHLKINACNVTQLGIEGLYKAQ